MKSPYGIFMVEDVDSESQARDICSIWVNRKTNQSHTDGVWQSWREIARFRPAEGRRVARKLGVVRLYDEPHPFELVLKVRRPWPRSPSP